MIGGFISFLFLSLMSILGTSQTDQQKHELDLIFDQPMPDSQVIYSLVNAGTKIPLTQLTLRGLLANAEQTGSIELLDRVVANGLNLSEKVEGSDQSGIAYILNSETDIAINWLLTMWMDGRIAGNLPGEVLVLRPLMLSTLVDRAPEHLLPSLLLSTSEGHRELSEGRRGAIQVILDRDGTISEKDRALYLVLESGDFETAQFLVDHGADLEGTQPFLHALALSPVFNEGWTQRLLSQDVVVWNDSWMAVALARGNIEFAAYVFEKAKKPVTFEQLLQVPVAASMKYHQGYVELMKGALECVDSHSALYMIVHKGHMGALSALSHALSDFDPNCQDEKGNTSLHLAGSLGKVEITRFLLQMGADPYVKNNAGDLPNVPEKLILETALDTPLPKLLEAFFERDGTIEYLQTLVPFPLHIALKREKAQDNLVKETISLLIAHGADVDAQGDLVCASPLLQAVRSGHFDSARVLIEKGANVTLTTQSGEGIFHAFARAPYADEAFLEEMLRKGLDINQMDNGAKTPLWHALDGKNIKLSHLLIQHGASCDHIEEHKLPFLHWLSMIPISNLSCEDKELHQELFKHALESHSNPAAVVAGSGNMEALGLLLAIADEGNWSVDVNACDSDGKSPLHYAVSHKRSSMVKWLLENGADPTLADAEGATALHIASRLGTRGIARSLTKAGGLALFDLQDNSGRTPRDYDFCYEGTATNFLKIFGHAWELEGAVELGNYSVELEGSFGIAFLPYALESVSKAHQNNPEVITQARHQLLKGLFARPLDFSTWPYENYGEGAAAALRAINKETVLTLTGWNGHGITVLLHKGYLMVCNRGLGSVRPIDVYRIDEKLVTASVMFELNWQNVFDFEETLPVILRKLHATKDWVAEAVETLCPIRDNQVVGNCAWESIETALCALLTVEELLENGGDEARNIAAVESAFDAFQLFSQQLRLDLAEGLVSRLEQDCEFKDSQSIHQMAEQVSKLPLEELAEANPELDTPKEMLRRQFECRAHASEAWRLGMQERFTALKSRLSR